MLALVVTLYLVMGPAHWFKKLMDLTHMSWGYKMFLMGLGVMYLLMAWTFEKHFAMPLARWLGVAKQSMTGRAKRRKEYKTIREDIWRVR